MANYNTDTEDAVIDDSVGDSVHSSRVKAELTTIIVELQSEIDLNQFFNNDIGGRW